MPPNTLKVDRSTRWGNPFGTTQSYMAFQHRGYPAPCEMIFTPPSLERSIDLFRAYLRGRLAADADFLEPLRGKNLACWCPLDQECHGDVLLRIANRTKP